MKIIKKNKIFKILTTILFLLITFNVYNFFARTVNGDEAILAEQAKELAINGYVRSPMFTGMGAGWESSQLHYHKLFIWLGALVYKVFGTSIYALRAISLLALIILINAIYQILKTENHHKNKFIIVCILLLSNLVVYRQGLIYRPEMLLAALAVYAFYFMQKAINKKSLKYTLVSSVFGGIAVLTHLNGLSIVFANVVLLFWNKQFVRGIASGFISGAISALYFIDINTKEKFIQFKTQFFSDPNFEEGTLGIFSPIIKILNEHMRFFHDVYAITFTVFFLVVLGLAFNYLKKKHRYLLIYFLFLVIGLASISHGATIKYAILYYPFMSLIIVYGLFYIAKTKLKYINLSIGVFALYFIINIGYAVHDSMNFINTVKRSDNLNRKMNSKKVNVFAPEYFYFNQEKNFNIRIPLSYTLRVNDYKKGEPTTSDFYNYNSSMNNYYIILDGCITSKQVLECSNYAHLQKNDTIFSYKVINVDEELKLLEKLN